jgi:hypothetical protein
MKLDLGSKVFWRFHPFGLTAICLSLSGNFGGEGTLYAIMGREPCRELARVSGGFMSHLAGDGGLVCLNKYDDLRGLGVRIMERKV